jgi:hypothetical protein
MSATSTLRRHLDDLNINYSTIGSVTRIRDHDGYSWYMRDRYDGTLDARLTRPITPAAAVELVGRKAQEAPTAIAGLTAEIGTICDDDGVGHSWCTNCERTVGPHFHYCPWCGAEFKK